MKLTKQQILQVISILNIKGKLSNNSYFINCPYHLEDTPSFSIKLDEGFCKCFGCGITKSFNNFCKDIYNQSAYSLLGINTFDNLTDYYFKKSLVVKDRKQNIDKKVNNISGQLLEVYDNKEVYEHLIKYRRLSNNVIEEFDIKYTNKLEINRKEVIDNDDEEDDIKGTFFYNRIMIPVYYKNELVNYEGRDYTFKQTPKVLYPKNTLKPLFNYDNLDKNKPLYLVEGFMDFAIIYENISKNSTCIMGNQLNELQVKLLNEFKEIIVIADNDNGGIVLEKQIDNFYERDFYVVRLPEGIKDVGECDIRLLHKCIAEKTIYVDKELKEVLVSLFN